MAADDFFRRWSKPKPDGGEPGLVQTPPVPAPAAAPAPSPADLAALGRDSDFKPFLAQGVDEALKRSALKKLFSDPHFAQTDGLDVYIEDFHKFEALPAITAAALNHAKSLLRRALDEPAPAEPAAPAAPPDDTKRQNTDGS